MPPINWLSLPSFTFSPGEKITVSYGISNEEVICVRADLRSYYNGFPTRVGVNLKRWELHQLGRYLGDLDQKQDETADELTITKLENGDISLHKRNTHYKIARESIPAVKEIIPGICTMLEILKDPTTKHPANLLQDIFIFSKLVGDSPGSINTVWDAEKRIIIERDFPKELKLPPSWEWDVYQSFFGSIPNLSAGRQDFIDKFSGSFVDNLKGMLDKDEGAMLRSFTLFIKEITK